MISFSLSEIFIYMYFLRTLKLTDVFGISSDREGYKFIEEVIYPQLMTLKLGCPCQTLQSESHGQPSKEKKSKVESFSLSP